MSIVKDISVSNDFELTMEGILFIFPFFLV